jgi:hypothetical protein
LFTRRNDEYAGRRLLEGSEVLWAVLVRRLR